MYLRDGQFGDVILPDPAALSVAEPLASGEVEVPIDGGWIQGGGQFYIEQRAPLPLTVLGITAEVVFGG